MYKICERKDKMSGYYISEYDIGDMQWPEFLKIVQSSPIQTSIVHVLEHVEQDMQNISGTYSLDDVIHSFSEMMCAANTSCGIHICLFFDIPDSPTISFDPLSCGRMRVLASTSGLDLNKLLDIHHHA